ncbi:hypothetical protein [Bacillus sp. Marseille-P3661]|uniref:hypothetical protein n=1 Tax=Bacillus sp. Marseille-P3661 TaxID=1936234 RepID=UPI0011570798|nr:hypothetical protein [Bacillus sp. Marseille-P3661]
MKTLKQLNEIQFEENQLVYPTIDRKLCKKHADSIEVEAKSLFIIIFLIDAFLSGLLEKQSIQTSPDKLTVHVQKPGVNVNDPTKILEVIKSGLHLNDLPTSIKELEESPEILEHLFLNRIHPVVVSQQDDQYFKRLKQLFIQYVSEISGDTSINGLTPEQQSFLYTKLIEYLEKYQKYILLEYLVLSLCEGQ